VSIKYEHIIGAICGTPWAIEPGKLSEIVAVVAHHAAGQDFSADEIEARIGARSQGVSQGQGVGVLPIRGTISHRMGSMDESSGGVSTERLSGMLAAYMADETVGSILLDIDSPGGTVTGVSELAAQLFAARGQGKPIVALVNGMAASAAYWLASQADEIVSIPSGLTGSIGVYTAHQDMSAALDKEGVKVTLISAGTHKLEGNPFEPLSDEARAVVQARVDDAYAVFVKDVARGRGVTPGDVRKGYGEGRVLGAKDAKAAGLIDRIGTVEETLGRVMGRSRPSMRAETDAALVAEAIRLEAF
jgi:signal peptide peptidase SppA